MKSLRTKALNLKQSYLMNFLNYSEWRVYVQVHLDHKETEHARCGIVHLDHKETGHARCGIAP